MTRAKSSGLLISLPRDGYTLSLAKYAPGMRMTAHAHDTADMGFVISGALEEEVGKSRQIASSGAFVVKPAGVVHKNVFGPAGALMLSIRFTDIEKQSQLMERTLEKWAWESSTAVARAAFQPSRRMTAVRPAREDLDEFATDLLATVVSEIRAGEFDQIPRWLTDLRRRIETDNSSITKLAAELGLHPVYVARRFRSAFGCSLREYRCRARVMRAVHLLGQSSGSISHVAHASGFSDHAHLSRQTKVLLGLSPSSVRSLQAFGATGT